MWGGLCLVLLTGAGLADPRGRCSSVPSRHSGRELPLSSWLQNGTEQALAPRGPIVFRNLGTFQGFRGLLFGYLGGPLKVLWMWALESALEFRARNLPYIGLRKSGWVTPESKCPSSTCKVRNEAFRVNREGGSSWNLGNRSPRANQSWIPVRLRASDTLKPIRGCSGDLVSRAIFGGPGSTHIMATWS